MHYVISDLHAHIDIYTKFKQTLSENDKVFILGDVIDKGDGTLDILIDAINDDNIILLMGNHELMMWEYLTACRTDNTIAIYKYGDRWLYKNDGMRTYTHYKNLDKHIQDKIYNYLSSLYLQYAINVNNNNFILTHSVPYGNKKVLFRDNCKVLNNYENEADKWVWDRIVYKYIANHIVVTGHNIVQYYYGYKNSNECIVETDGIYHCDSNVWICDRPGRWYDIDMGLAMNNKNSKLAILRLEDLSIRYIKS